MKAGPSRRAVLKAGGALLGGVAGAGAITGFPTDLGAGHQEHRAAPRRRVVLGGQGDRRSSLEGSRLQGHDAEPRHLGRDQSLHHATEHRRHRGRRRLAGEACHQTRRAARHRSQEDQGIRQHPADFHQGRVQRQSGVAPGHLALRSDVHLEAGCDRAARGRDRLGHVLAAGLQRRLDRLPSRSDQETSHRMERVDQPRIQRQGGDSRRAGDRHHGRGAVLRKCRR